MTFKAGFTVIAMTLLFLTIASCGKSGGYGAYCGGHGDCVTGVCANLEDVSRCSQRCSVVPCPNGDPCLTSADGEKFCGPGLGGAAGELGAPRADLGGVGGDLGGRPCAVNDDCGNATQYCRKSAGRGECQSCAAEQCGQPCQGGAPGRCLDGSRLLFCYSGQYRVVDCTLRSNVCGTRTVGAPQCEAVAAGCSLSSCTSSGFSYSCATGSRQTRFNYGGPGPNGVSSYTVTFSNGHTVTCTFFSNSRGSCRDDTGATCSF